MGYLDLIMDLITTLWVASVAKYADLIIITTFCVLIIRILYYLFVDYKRIKVLERETDEQLITILHELVQSAYTGNVATKELVVRRLELIRQDFDSLAKEYRWVRVKKGVVYKEVCTSLKVVRGMLDQ